MLAKASIQRAAKLGLKCKAGKTTTIGFARRHLNKNGLRDGTLDTRFREYDITRKRAMSDPIRDRRMMIGSMDPSLDAAA
jgi:hypothetical protein